MKEIIFLLLILPFYSNAQDNSCRNIAVKQLNYNYKDLKGFNSYFKDGNICVDLEIDIGVTLKSYQNTSQGDKMLEESAKDGIYNILTTMNNNGYFSHSDVEECTFYNVMFYTTYITRDYNRIHYNFKIPYYDMANIKDNLNKSDVFYKLILFGKFTN